MFRTSDGAELLKLWRETYVEARTFDVDPITMAGRSARKDFVSDIDSILREVAGWNS